MYIQTREELSAILFATYAVGLTDGKNTEPPKEHEQRSKDAEEVNEYMMRWIEMPWRGES